MRARRRAAARVRRITVEMDAESAIAWWEVARGLCGGFGRCLLVSG